MRFAEANHLRSKFYIKNGNGESHSPPQPPSHPSFNDRLCLTQIENRLTGESFPILDDPLVSLRTSEGEIADFELLEVVEKPHAIHLTTRSGEVRAEVEYRLGEEDHYMQKRIWLGSDRDLELQSVTAAGFTLGEGVTGVYVHKYPDFDLVEAQVEKDYAFGIRREKDTEPCRTVFLPSPGK